MRLAKGFFLSEDGKRAVNRQPGFRPGGLVEQDINHIFPVPSHPMPSCPVLSGPIPPVPSGFGLLRPTPPRSKPSRQILFRPAPSCLILLHLVRPILSRSVPDLHQFLSSCSPKWRNQNPRLESLQPRCATEMTHQEFYQFFWGCVPGGHNLKTKKKTIFSRCC